MTVDTAYNTMRFIARKNQIASLSPSDFQFAFNTAQRNYYDLLVGRIEQYRYDKPTPRIGLSMTDNVVSRLTPFKKQANITVTAGIGTKPTDFNKLLSMTTINAYRVYRVEENRAAERFHDSIDGISEGNAFFIEDDTSWRILPVTLDFVSVRYLYCPVDVVWGYTLDGSGRPVYNSGTSVQPKWDDNDMDEIIGRALKVLGVSIKEGALLNYGEQVIQKGE
jgi:hypothetical protein